MSQDKRTRRDLIDTLRGASVGPLRWQPPLGMSSELDGSRWGSGSGFFLHSSGAQTNHAPRTVDRKLRFDEALTIAEVIDSWGMVSGGGGFADQPKTAVAWVQRIIRALPELIGTAEEAKRAELDELRTLRAEAIGMRNAMDWERRSAAAVERDDDVPF